MTTFRKIIFGFWGLYLFAALPLAHAEGPGPDGSSPQWHAGQRIQEIYRQLNLTDDQKKQLEINKRHHRAIMESARQEMRAKRQALQEELMKPQLDTSRINELQKQINALQSQVEDNKLNSILAVREILTPEQFLEFINLMHKHKQEHDK